MRLAALTVRESKSDEAKLGDGVGILLCGLLALESKPNARHIGLWCCADEGEVVSKVSRSQILRTTALEMFSSDLDEYIHARSHNFAPTSP